MKQKQKIWVWFVLVSFLLSTFVSPFCNNTAKAATVSGYANEGVAFYVKNASSSDFSAVYRLYKSTTTEHIYTQDETEKTTALAAGYVLDPPTSTDGIAFYAHKENIIAGTENIVAGTASIVADTAPQTDSLIADEGLVPVYRLYNSSTNSRFYTASTDDKTDAIDNLSFVIDPSTSTDGIAFYAYPTTLEAAAINSKNLVPVYQFHNPTTGDYIYTTSENEKTILLTEASTPPTTNLGPEISVGLWNNTKSSLNDTPYKIKGSKNYNIKDAAGNILASVPAGTTTRVASYTVTTTQIIKDDGGGGGGGGGKKKKKKKKKKKEKSTKKSSKKTGGQVLGASTVKGGTKKKTTKKTVKKKKKKSAFMDLLIPTAYADDQIITTNTEYLKIYGSAFSGEKQLGVQELYFDAVDGNNTDMIFDVYRPGSDYNAKFDQYRDKMKIKYTDDDNIWMINILPMEHYIWGMGEMSGTGPMEHSKVMTTIFRTYGYWYSQYATKYMPWGFRIRSDSGSQIYRGYDWEMGVPSQGIAAHPNIRTAAEETWGKVVTYQNDIALTPYSSWTDGRTRSFEERWGGNDYPWCQSVADPYGKHPTLGTDALVSAGNHMVGLSAHGSLNLAGSGSKYDNILKYYFTGTNGHRIELTSEYNR